MYILLGGVLVTVIAWGVSLVQEYKQDQRSREAGEKDIQNLIKQHEKEHKEIMKRKPTKKKKVVKKAKAKKKLSK